jgi:hypothetical protein
MGIQITLLVGQEHNLQNDRNLFFETLATVELGTGFQDSKISRLWSASNKGDFTWYWYDMDGQEKITEDKYGKKPKCYRMHAVLSALESDIEKEPTDVLQAAHALVRHFNDSPATYYALLYGH